VPANAQVDAVSVDGGGLLLLSFDTTVSLGGVGFVDDEDLVQSAGGGLYAMVYDGSAQGIAPSLDLDAAQANPPGPVLWLSFDGSGAVGAVSFDDEDVLAFDTGALTYAMYFDASLSDPADWPAADLVAVPESGVTLGLAAGAGLLAALRRLRRRDGPGPGRSGTGAVEAE
jgi:hypothetical protein